MRMFKKVQVLVLIAIFAAILFGCKKEAPENPLKTDGKSTTKAAPGNTTVTDVDGNIYNTITIGTQIWMVENLQTTRFRDGSAMDNVTNNSAWAARYYGNGNPGAYCWYNNYISNKTTYGALYNEFAIENSCLAPYGWHVPTTYEWETLTTYLGGIYNVAGGKMKSIGTTYWFSPNYGANNSSGFSALPGGIRNSGTGIFASLRDKACFWSSTTDQDAALSRTLFSYNADILTDNPGKTEGRSVRCVRDPAELPNVTTSNYSSLTYNSVICGGNVTFDGWSNVTSRGVCYGTTHNPTTSGSHTMNGSGMGSFVSSITGLTQNTIYYLRAYAVNAIGTSYGTEISFMTLYSNPLVIGQNYDGGIVAYILQYGDPGWTAGMQKGFIAAPSDQSTGIAWDMGLYNNPATGSALGQGFPNTSSIINAVGSGSYAAKLCSDLVLNVHDDWFLPSKNELHKLYLSKTAIGGFEENYYWSSTCGLNGGAYAENFSNGNQSEANKNATYYVRAIRAFAIY